MNSDPDTNVVNDLKPDNYFSLQKNSLFWKLFDKETPIWTALDRIDQVAKSFFRTNDMTETLKSSVELQTWVNRDNVKETLLFFKKGFYADEDKVFSDYGLALGRGSTIEPGVVIKPPLVTGKYTEIRQGAYIRGGAIVGNYCTIGHTTEVKTAIIMNHSEAGHFAYIGDSIVGNYVNLGAGTKLANLPFRNLAQKQNKVFNKMDLVCKNQKISLGRSKFGAVLGDGVETGCNSTLAPGSIIGRNSWVYPCVFVKRGFYSENSIIKSGFHMRISSQK